MAERKSGTTDEAFMRRALRIARKGEGQVSPNPMVGAVIVREGRIIAEGYHRCCGANHAEINALQAAREPVKGATLYVTLEPCAHHGRTPPCVEALIACRIGRVVIGTMDPNPLVCGKGIKALRRKGIETTVGVLEEACLRLNEGFFKFIRTGIPFVTVKFAQTLDGRIATSEGHSRWISSPASLRFAHRLRATHDAILVGAGTALKDDPELTCRLVPGKTPLRIVVDSRLRIPPESRLFSAGTGERGIIATTERAPERRRRLFEKRGIELLTLESDRNGQVDLGGLLSVLGQRGITSLLVEGGAALITSFLKGGLADRLIVVIAPKITGEGINAIGDLGIRRMDDALNLSVARILRRDGDWILDARLRPGNRPDAPPPGSRPGPN
jgi:diaminohydroxyphosphoribosylaminopyrimidine deaminase/5-amino-6-(5-phosphoribosylamino)uracil reductase